MECSQTCRRGERTGRLFLVKGISVRTNFADEKIIEIKTLYHCRNLRGCGNAHNIALAPAHATGDANAYPGVERTDGSKILDEKYTEGIYVGYRWYDTKKIRPLFAFGHGLSYTTFKYGKVTADSKTMTADGTLTLSVDVTNTGDRAGAEVVQLYVSGTQLPIQAMGFARQAPR